MPPPAARWKLGLFVVVGLAAAFGVLLWLGAVHLERESLTAVTYFDESVQGLDVGAPVKFRGVTIGMVSRIAVAPDRRHVEVVSDIDIGALVHLGLREAAQRAGEEIVVPQGLRAQLVPVGITGLVFVDVNFFDPKAFPPPTLPFPPLEGAIYIPAAPSALRSLQEAAVVALDRLPALEARAVEVLGRADEALEELRGFGATLSGTGSPLLSLLERLDRATSTLERELRQARLGATAESLRSASAAVGEAAREVGASSREVSREVGSVGDEVRKALDATRDALEAVRALADYLERNPSALVRGRAPGSPPPEGRR